MSHCGPAPSWVRQTNNGPRGNLADGDQVRLSILQKPDWPCYQTVNPVAWQNLDFLSDAQIAAWRPSSPCAPTPTSVPHDQPQRTTCVSNLYPEFWGFPLFRSWKHQCIMRGCSNSSPLVHEHRLYVTSWDLTPQSRARELLWSHLWSRQSVPGSRIKSKEMEAYLICCSVLLRILISWLNYRLGSWNV